MKKIVLAVSAVMALAACSQDQPAPRPAAAAPAPVAAAPAPATQTATVNASSLSLRVSASTRARRIATLRRGTEVQVLDVSGNWAHVMAGASEGYVQKNYLRM